MTMTPDDRIEYLRAGAHMHGIKITKYESDILLRIVDLLAEKGGQADLSELAMVSDGIEHKEQTCKECGCTNNDCTPCITRTGQACHWVQDDLCSACAETVQEEEATHE